MQVRLKILKGSKARKIFRLPTPNCLIGRSNECHLRPRMSAISHRHCLITTTDSGVVVSDLKSRNGTFVNGERVTEVTPLDSGDHLQIGPLVFEVVIDVAQVERSMIQEMLDDSLGTADGSESVATLVVESSRKLQMLHPSPVLESEQFLDESSLEESTEPPRFVSGQVVIISRGVLQDVTGTIVKRVSGGEYLVALGGQKRQILAKLPAHLIREA